MSKLFESRNPILSDSAMNKTINRSNDSTEYVERMSVDGAVNKSMMLFCIMMITTMVGYNNPSTMNLIIGAVGGIIAVLVGTFKPTTAPISAPIYALFEGLFVGSISAIYAAQFSGIVGQAVMLTFGTLIVMLGVYKSGLIKVTEKFKMGVFMATGAIMFTYIISFVLSFFGMSVPLLHSNGIMGIGISLVIIAVASLNLLIDFDSFEKGEASGAPKYMEWVCAMGLLVTLVWLYIEFLRLLSKLQRD
ncbi:MAG: Bax inhibitor-1/YccA family protein [Saprospiraceae bacterium]